MKYVAIPKEVLDSILNYITEKSIPQISFKEVNQLIFNIHQTTVEAKNSSAEEAKISSEEEKIEKM